MRLLVSILLYTLSTSHFFDLSCLCYRVLRACVCFPHGSEVKVSALSRAQCGTLFFFGPRTPASLRAKKIRGWETKKIKTAPLIHAHVRNPRPDSGLPGMCLTNPEYDGQRPELSKNPERALKLWVKLRVFTFLARRYNACCDSRQEDVSYFCFSPPPVSFEIRKTTYFC